MWFSTITNHDITIIRKLDTPTKFPQHNRLGANVLKTEIGLVDLRFYTCREAEKSTA